MTDKQLARIKKPSKLIAIALDDLKKAERSGKYEIDMSFYHVPLELPYTAGRYQCAVCLAGSVMAFSLKANSNFEALPTEFKSSKQLIALDYLRRGVVHGALEYLTGLKFNTIEFE